LLKKELGADDEFNYISLQSKDTESFQEAIELSPVMSESKTVVISGIDFAKEWKSDDVSLVEELLEDVPPYTNLIFSCIFADKKSKIYKLLSSKCTECFFDYKKSSELVGWVVKVVKSKGGNINTQTAEMVTEYVGKSMNCLINEIDKMLSYVGENGEITPQVVKDICTRNIEARVYDLLDYAMAKQGEKAFLVLNELQREKEQPVFVANAIMRNILGTLQHKYLKEQGKTSSFICDKMGIKPFVEKKYAVYGKRYSEEFLKEMVSECASFDMGFKSGEMDGYTGLFLLVSKLL
jgi:DNA polymerase-3 subunit delta